MKRAELISSFYRPKDGSFRVDAYYKYIEGVVAHRTDLRLVTHRLRYPEEDYSFVEIWPERVDPKKPVILLRVNVHGEEKHTPLFAVFYLSDTIDYASDKGVQMIWWLTGNPCGLDRGVRYNPDYERRKAKAGFNGNNDFVYYTLADGRVVDSLRGGKEFVEWGWARDVKKLPRETVLASRILRGQRWQGIFDEGDSGYRRIGLLDIHEDHEEIDGIRRGSYAFVFGEGWPYGEIVRSAEQIAPIGRNLVVDAGDGGGKVTTDNLGLIPDYRDGTLQDLFSHLGATHSVTVETLRATLPADKAEIYRVWALGLIGLLAEK